MKKWMVYSIYALSFILISVGGFMCSNPKFAICSPLIFHLLGIFLIIVAVFLYPVAAGTMSLRHQTGWWIAILGGGILIMGLAGLVMSSGVTPIVLITSGSLLSWLGIYMLKTPKKQPVPTGRTQGDDKDEAEE